MKDSSITLWEKALGAIKATYNFLVNVPIMKFFKVVLYVIVILSLYTAFNWINKGVNVGASKDVVKTAAKEAFIGGVAEVDSLRVVQKMKEASISDEIDDNLNDLSLNMLNLTDADRTMVSLFHDGEYTSGHIDFKFMNECYEKINKEHNISKVTGYYRDPHKRYDDIPTRDLPIYRYLRQHKENFFVGDTKTLAEIDPDYASRMDSDGMGYTAMYYIHENGLPLSIISVSWKKGDEKHIPSAETLIGVLKQIAVDAKPYLYIDAYNKMKQTISQD